MPPLPFLFLCCLEEESSDVSAKLNWDNGRAETGGGVLLEGLNGSISWFFRDHGRPVTAAGSADQWPGALVFQFGPSAINLLPGVVSSKKGQVQFSMGSL